MFSVIENNSQWGVKMSIHNRKAGLTSWAAIVLVSLSASAALAQNSVIRGQLPPSGQVPVPSIGQVPPQADVAVTVTAQHRAIAAAATDVRCHILPPQGVNRADIKNPGCQAHGSLGPRPGVGPQGQKPTGPSNLGGVNSLPFFYPENLVDNGGPVLTTVQNHNGYTNSPTNPASAHWGGPTTLQNALFQSQMIHLVDQYMKVGGGCPSLPCTNNNRYTQNTSAIVTISSPPQPLLDSDIHAAVVAMNHALFPSGGGGGYTQMYHVFLPSGQDLCFDSGHGSCYAPTGNPACSGNTCIFQFCGYHGSFTGLDNLGASTHFVYSAQPYMFVNGCTVSGGPQGNPLDSTANVLSHEIFEAITDPDLNAWWQSDNSRPGAGQENGDLCAWWTMGEAGYTNPVLAGTAFKLQLEYDNKYGGCGNAP